MMKNPKRWLVALLCVGAIGWAGQRLVEHFVTLAHVDVSLGGAGIVPPDDPNKFSPFQVVPPFPAITNAPVMLASEITGEVTDRELVLGVTVNGESRAYPINMLTGPDREIINDVLGGTAIAATW